MQNTYKKHLILASKSKIRQKILKNAGLVFKVESASFDERKFEKEKEEKTIKEVALALAEQKALLVSQKYKNEEVYVIGCDQVLEYDKKILHKVNDIETAKSRLKMLAGKKHALHSAFAIAKGDKILKSSIDTAKLTMRALSQEDIDAYFVKTDKDILSSVGCYQIENIGITLFKKIKGDYYTIMGLPLLPLLCDLRSLNLIL